LFDELEVDVLVVEVEVGVVEYVGFDVVGGVVECWVGVD